MPAKKKPGNGKGIQDLEIEEISLVDIPATGKRWAMKKRAEMDELAKLIEPFFTGFDAGSDAAGRLVLAKAATDALPDEERAQVLAAAKILAKYRDAMSGLEDLVSAIQVLFLAGPAMEIGVGDNVAPVAKSGGALDALLSNLMLGSGNRRMVESVLKGVSIQGLEDADEGLLEDDVAPGQRGISKSIKHQEEDVAPEVKEDYWPSL